MTQAKKNKKKPSFTRNQALHLILRLSNNTVSLFLFFTIILFMLYSVGNYQQFTDASQLVILKIISVSANTMCFIAFIALIVHIVNIFAGKFKKKHILSIIYFFITLIIGIFFVFYSTLISKLSTGIF